MNLVNGLVMVIIFKMVNGFGNVIDQTVNESFTALQTVIELVSLVVIHHERRLCITKGSDITRLVVVHHEQWWCKLIGSSASQTMVVLIK